MLLLPLAMLLSTRKGAEFWGAICGIAADIAYSRPLGFNVILFLTACLAAKLIPSRASAIKTSIYIIPAIFIWAAADYSFFGLSADVSAEIYANVVALSVLPTIVMCAVFKKFFGLSPSTRGRNI